MKLESEHYMDTLRLAGRQFDIHHVRGATSNIRQACFCWLENIISTSINKKER